MDKRTDSHLEQLKLSRVTRQILFQHLFKRQSVCVIKGRKTVEPDNH